MKRIFIIGSERSGTNLLRTLLGNHPDINSPTPVHLFELFYKHIALYGDFSSQEKVHKCLQDLVTYVNLNFSDWRLKIDIDLVIKKYQPKNLVESVDLVYSEKAIAHNKQGYIAKENSSYKFVSDIIANFPDSKFIYIYRDPRDHTVSWLKNPIYMHTAYEIINKWNSEQEMFLYLSHLHSNVIFPISYEDLIQQTQSSINSLLNFIGLELDSKCYTTNLENEEANKNPLWKNLNKPIDNSNHGKFLKNLNGFDLRIIESLSKKNMIKLGYTNFVTEGNWTGSKKLSFRGIDLLRKIYSIIINQKSRKSLINNVLKEKYNFEISMNKRYQ